MKGKPENVAAAENPPRRVPFERRIRLFMATAAALVGAEEAGIFEALGDGALSSSELARRVGADVEVLSPILEILRELGVVRCSEGEWGITGELRGMLEGSSQMGERDFASLWAGYKSVLSPAATTVEARPPRFATDYAADLREHGLIAECTAQDVVARLRALVLPIRRVLDLGTGSAAFASEFAKGGSVVVDAVDRATVTAALPSTVDSAVNLIAGDLFDLPAAIDHYDIVLIANVFHLYAKADARRLLAIACDHLVDGGGVAVVEPVFDLWPDPLAAAAYSVDVRARTRAGVCYRDRDIRSLFASVGLILVDRTRLSYAGEPQWLYVGAPGTAH
ncbi:methyltransferase [Streptomyces sp. NPDC048179]|uniref:methyltransferase n=1 Tax=Streptomyces sp. NPDC048179 TaxID=3365506 RepID=UPI003723E0EA